MTNPEVSRLARKLAIYAAPFTLTLLAFVAYMYFMVPANTPAAIHHAVLEDKIHRLIVLATDTPRVIFAGDSRANANIVPKVFEEKTGLTTVNAAVNYGSLAETYDAFKENGVLGKKRLIVISESSYDINDAVFHFQDVDWQIVVHEPFGIQKLQDIWRYYYLFLNFEFDQFKRFLRAEDLRKDAFMTPAQVSEQGYLANDGHMITQGPNRVDIDRGLYENRHVDGVKLGEFLRAIRGFGASNDTIVLYMGPIAPLLRETFANSDAPLAEDHFIQVIKDSIQAYPNIHFVDVRLREFPELTDDMFADWVHLNDSGAPIFTAHMAEILRAQKFIK